jgi:hypothetical protein
MSLGSRQRAVGKSQVHLTPRWILDPLGQFDTDPCASEPRPWPTARRHITARENSLAMPWDDFGRIWLNPPFDTRIVGEFIRRMIAHDHGTALVHARTETLWFQPMFDAAAALFFIRGRVGFHKPDGSRCTTAKGVPSDSGAPVVLIAFGPSDADILATCGLPGKFVPLALPRSVLALAVSGTWRDELMAWMRARRGPVRLADLYEAFRDHPKARGRKHYREKLRQVLQRGPFERTASGEWRAA